MTTITAIVPRLPPAVDGLGDYGFKLACQLRQDFAIDTEFIVGRPEWDGNSEIEGFKIQQVSDWSASSLLELLPHHSELSSTILLHYVGYGYAKRGCPVWLVKALEQWRKSASHRRLVTMFHEVYAFSPQPWSSQFWTSPLQKNLAKRLACVSDICLTSKESYGEIVCQLSNGKHTQIPTLPVFSNIGEPKNISPLSERSRQLVVFGGGGPRTRVYQQSHPALERACQVLEIEKIIDIGPPLGFDPTPISGVPILSMGIQPPEKISRILSEAVAGFFNYPLDFLAKSTIFAAYCAHGLLPIGVHYEGNNVDGLVAETHYWLADRDKNMTLLEGQEVANNAYSWYQGHRLSVQASMFARYLQGNS